MQEFKTLKIIFTIDKIFFNYILIICLSSGYLSECVRITELKVPTAVLNGSHIGVDLACMYRLGPDDNGFVLKWFMNGNPRPVYQWIGGLKPQILEPLRGRAGLSIRGPNAIRISKPTIDLTGEYKCHVSTFHTEDYMHKIMTVYVPEEVLKFKQIKDNQTGSVSFHCKAVGIFPRPELMLYRNLYSVRVPLKRFQTEFQKRGSIYDVETSATLRDEEIYTTTVISCQLKIPGTNYTKLKNIVYSSAGALPWIDYFNSVSRSWASSISYFLVILLNLFQNFNKDITLN